MGNMYKDIVNLKELGEREWDVKELFNSLRNNTIVWSWGAERWSTDAKEGLGKWLRFKSNGHHHKGHVYITLAWNDTFRIYYTTLEGKIKSIEEDIYIDSLINTIDAKIEYVEFYG